MTRRLALPVFSALTVLALVLVASPAFAEKGKVIQKSFPFVGDRDVKVGVKVGPVSIDSFRIRNWPDEDDLEKGDRDHGDTSTMVVEFEYTNRDDDHDYKCRYVVRVPGPGGEAWAENDREATLDKGKYGDTNKMFVKMKTYRYRKAKKIDVSFEIWKR